MSQKINLFDSYFNEYHDRGIQKWNGFYLSEHTAAIATEQQKKSTSVIKKRRMSTQEINQLLEFSFNNRQKIIVQLEIVDLDGNYSEDTVGFIEGFDALGLTIGQTKVHYDEIRHIELCTQKRWNDMA